MLLEIELMIKFSSADSSSWLGVKLGKFGNTDGVLVDIGVLLAEIILEWLTSNDGLLKPSS